MQLLGDALVAHVGFISEGAPYVTPMSFVVDGPRIVFRTKAGKKLDALRSEPRVCIEVCAFDDRTGDWASVIVTGTADEVEDRPTRELVVQELFDKYSSALSEPLSRGGPEPLPGSPHVIAVTINEITGRSSGSGFAPRTRPGRL